MEPNSKNILSYLTAIKAEMVSLLIEMVEAESPSVVPASQAGHPRDPG